MVRKFCSTLKGSYRFVSSTTTPPRTENDVKTLQAKEKYVKPFHQYAMVRKFCSTLKGSYRFVSSTTTPPRTENDVKTLQAKENYVKPFHQYASRTTHF
jgi:DUF1365 family protein